MKGTKRDLALLAGIDMVGRVVGGRDRYSRGGPPGPPGWWLRLQRRRDEAKKLRHNRIWGVWEAMSAEAKERYMERHAEDQSHRVTTVYPSWAAVCRPVRHRRSKRGRVKTRSYR